MSDKFQFFEVTVKRGTKNHTFAGSMVKNGSKEDLDKCFAELINSLLTKFTTEEMRTATAELRTVELTPPDNSCWEEK